jgi:hypothetical protein
MRIRLQLSRKAEQGYGLLITLGFAALCLVLLGSVCKMASTESTLTARNVVYNNAVIAAESATESAISQMTRDFRYQRLSTNSSKYSGILPSTFVPNGWTADYQFFDSQGTVDQTDIVCQNWGVWTNLNSEFAGLYGLANTYEITSTAKRITGPYKLAAAVRQNVQFVAIPLFQFAIFYTLDLEINPGPHMIITGKTHSNGNLYIAPGNILQFADAVTAAGHIYLGRHPLDPTSPGNGKVIYESTHSEQVSTLQLPVGTDNSPTNVAKILDVPPSDEDPESELGRQRYYNKSDLIVTVTDTAVTLQYNNNEEGTAFELVGTNIATGTGFSFVNTNTTFWDYRESKQTLVTEIDVAAFNTWLTTGGSTVNVKAQSQMNHDINSIFVDDRRSATNLLTSVRLVNGRYLPPSGLTVATPLPIYVKGHFNAPDLATTNTINTKPSSLVCDAVTILSENWDDTYGKKIQMGSRNASDITVNAAFLSGIVPSQEDFNGGRHYSGGVENFPRFLENWSGTTMTYNGSMVVMFESRKATGYWNAPGNYYNPPKREWAFDTNFMDIEKLPPGTPQVRKLQRSQWNVVSAAAVNSYANVSTIEIKK